MSFSSSSFYVFIIATAAFSRFSDVLSIATPIYYLNSFRASYSYLNFSTFSCYSLFCMVISSDTEIVIGSKSLSISRSLASSIV